jgi:hypothetical protein
MFSTIDDFSRINLDEHPIILLQCAQAIRFGGHERRRQHINDQTAPAN